MERLSTRATDFLQQLDHNDKTQPKELTDNQVKNYLKQEIFKQGARKEESKTANRSDSVQARLITKVTGIPKMFQKMILKRTHLRTKTQSSVLTRAFRNFCAFSQKYGIIVPEDDQTEIAFYATVVSLSEVEKLLSKEDIE